MPPRNGLKVAWYANTPSLRHQTPSPRFMLRPQQGEAGLSQECRVLLHHQGLVRTNIHHHVHPFGPILLLQSEGFAETTTNSVSGDRIANPLGKTQAKSGTV